MPAPNKYPGYTQTTVAGLPWSAGALSFLQNASPPVVNGMIMVYQPTTSPDGFTYSIDGTGVPTIFSNGSVSRQSILFDVWDPVSSTWYGQVTEYINNQAPIVNYTGSLTLNYTASVPINNIDFNLYVSDPEGDPTTVTTSSILPQGLTLTAGILSGTPLVQGNVVISLIAKDFLNEATPFPTITISVAHAPTAIVPDLIGLSQSAAVSAITGLGFVPQLDAAVNSDTVAVDLVAIQSPAAGISQLLGTTVEYALSLGPVPVTPDIVNLSEADAIAAITAQILIPQLNSTAYSPTVPAGFVISQSPDAGIQMDTGSTVSYVLSLGPEPVVDTVPNVLRLSEADAINSITLAELTPQLSASHHSATVALGLVISQFPAAGAVLAPGSIVTYVLSLGPVPPPVIGNAVYAGRVIFETMKGSEVDMVVFDFLKSLASGETITAAVVTASVYTGVDSTPSNIINGSATISGSQVKQIINSGVVGTIYELLCTVTTSLGQTLKLAAYQAIQTDLP